MTYRIDARYVTAVEANSTEDALKAAEDKFQDAEFGEAEDIDGEAIIIEDDRGNYVWEK